MLKTVDVNHNSVNTFHIQLNSFHAKHLFVKAVLLHQLIIITEMKIKTSFF